MLNLFCSDFDISSLRLLKNKKSVKCLEYYDALFNPPGILEYPYFFKLNVSYAFYLV